jgi:hypothetical protein
VIPSSGPDVAVTENEKVIGDALAFNTAASVSAKPPMNADMIRRCMTIPRLLLLIGTVIGVGTDNLCAVKRSAATGDVTMFKSSLLCAAAAQKF